MPVGVWLCPQHRDEFYVPHGGICPVLGCGERLIGYFQYVVGLEKALVLLRAVYDEGSDMTWKLHGEIRAFLAKFGSACAGESNEGGH
jgi:hypothetical protein